MAKPKNTTADDKRVTQQQIRDLAAALTRTGDRLRELANELEAIGISSVPVSNYSTAQRGWEYVSKFVGSVNESISYEIGFRSRSLNVAEAAADFATAKKQSEKKKREP